MNKWINFYHPSTVVFVDDQKEFLDALQYRLSKNLISEFFTNPFSALNFIKANNGLTDIYKNLNLVGTDVSEIDLQERDVLTSFHLDEICKIVYNQERFNIQSVLVVDFMMPEIDGISFCKELKKYPIKKILLTAQTDHKLATNAFNEGLIDYFLIKEEGIINKLLQVIEKLQNSFFSSLPSNVLLDILPSIDKDSIADFYQKIISDFNVREFYLLDRCGSILMITKENKILTLVISTAEDLDDYASIAEDHENESIADILRSRKKILYFPQASDRLYPVVDWNRFLFQSTAIPHQKNMYYSIIKQAEFQPIDLARIEHCKK